MSDLVPYVRHMLLCEDARARSGEVKKVDVYGLMNAIRTEGATFPVTHSFTVYLALTAGRHHGRFQIVVTTAEAGERIYESPQYPIQFATDPLRVYGVIIHVNTCTFPRSGLYWVELWYNDKMLVHQPLEVS